MLNVMAEGRQTRGTTPSFCPAADKQIRRHVFLPKGVKTLRVGARTLAKRANLPGYASLHARSLRRRDTFPSRAVYKAVSTQNTLLLKIYL